MSTFNWRGEPSQLANEDKRMRLPVSSKAPGAASQITFSKKVPHSINTVSDDADRAKAARRASI